MDAKAEYAAFEEKVNRTIYVDNLSPLVTEAVLKAAFNQFGNVESVQFIPRYSESQNIPAAALIEMENSKQARQIIAEMETCPFMISGMPRPVRAHAAKIEMFDERPRKPGRRIQCQWLDAEDPDFKVANEIKQLVKRHAAQASHLLELQVKEEEELANQQAETLRTNYKKFELIDSVIEDGTTDRLAHRYKMRVSKT